MTIFNTGKSKQKLRSQSNCFTWKKKKQFGVSSQSLQRAFTFKKHTQSLRTHNSLTAVMLNS